MIDLLAEELKMDPAELRRKNFITEFPHTSHFGLEYDSGAYEKAMDMAMEITGHAKVRREQEEGRRKGKYIGIGMSSWIEICGFARSAATGPATGGLALLEAAQDRVV